MANVSLVSVNKSYSNGFQAVKDFNLEIRDGEFIIFVGPSGCGKSTTLRMVAGLEDISSGELWIDNQLANFLEPGERGLSMVFQNYALYPYMSVYENMAFGLRVNHLEKAEIDKRVREAAELLQISHLLDRKPNALSGGQKQRVAIGSVLVRKPKLFLMDEPLSNLDAKLRTQMRVELAKIHRQFGATIIYVTHDQVEAMTLGDRIVVMKEGVIQQVASPNELYNNPVNQFVAGFIGSPAMNFLKVLVTREGEQAILKCGEYRLAISKILERRLQEKGYLGKELMLGIRPEDLHEDGSETCRLQMNVMVREGLGAEVLLHGEIIGEPVCAKMPPSCQVQNHEKIWLYPDMSKVKLFDLETEENILYI
ncbi:MAG: sn-glycerol-3-phosphate ABC transporter ATP-binding protein UgpC [Eubacteriales bacterium]|nr:sn-glycerol-3-phosphate ABC transporter ATP-binding protein UgpC [Eubacteriales bacterium]